MTVNLGVFATMTTESTYTESTITESALIIVSFPETLETE